MTGTIMLPALRPARIIECLRRDGAAGLTEVSASLGVSVSILRRDVDYLCEQAQLERIHGGAIQNEGRRLGVELERDFAFELESDANRAIGLRAAAIIQSGQAVILDSGTTMAAVAPAARESGAAFNAITNDLAFVGPHALSEQETSDTSIELAASKRAIIVAAKRVVLLADRPKLFSRSFYSFGRVDDLHLLITDTRFTPDQRVLLAQNELCVDLVAHIGTVS